MSRYTAVVKIIKVDEAGPSTSFEDRNKKVQPAKQETELASFTVRNTDLNNLKSKLVAHIDLVEE